MPRGTEGVVAEMNAPVIVIESARKTHIRTTTHTAAGIGTVKKYEGDSKIDRT